MEEKMSNDLENQAIDLEKVEDKIRGRKMAKKLSRLEKTAYHEAGHAVISFFQKKRFQTVSIIPIEDSLGRVSNYKEDAKKFIDQLENELFTLRIRKQIEDRIMILFAGNIAEKLAAGRYNMVGSGSDYHQAFDLLFHISGSTEEGNAYAKWLFIRTKNHLSVSHIWPIVEALARELLEKQEIGYKTARRIIQDEIDRPFKDIKFIVKNGKVIRSKK